MGDHTTVKLLWTGGWDSTFRLLTLISQPNCVVQPYYVIHRRRRSWSIELKTMQKIIEACREEPKKFPGVVLSPIIAEKDDIAPNPEITTRYERLLSKGHLGGQIEWLARYADEHQLNDLEIGIEGDEPDTRPGPFSTHFLKYFEEGTSGSLSSMVLREDVPDDVLLFKCFSFPLINMSKKDMEKISRERGFQHIMEMTWFCFSPIESKWPCGMCVPCDLTIQQGLSYRIGWRGLSLHQFIRPLRNKIPQWIKAPLKKYAMKPPQYDPSRKEEVKAFYNHDV